MTAVQPVDPGMRTNALKKFEISDPASDSSPDRDVHSVSAETSSSRLPRPLSTFTSDESSRTQPLRRRAAAYCAAAILEFALLAAIWVALEPQPAQPPDDDSAAIEMVPAPPKPELTPPAPQKIELPTLKPVQVRSVPKMRLTIDPVLPIPSPQAALPNPPPTLPRPASSPPPASAEAVDRFDAEVLATIQAAIIYPPTAKMMKQQGRTKVAFRLVQGHAENPRIVQTSGIPAIDTAAVAAVRDAAYPAPPAELAGKPLEFAVFVEFNLSMHR
jgi:protein TonB